MIKRNQQFFNGANMLLDMAVTAGSFALVPLRATTVVLAAKTVLPAVLVWLSLALQGFYNTDRFYRLRQKAWLLFLALALSTAVTWPVLWVVGAAPHAALFAGAAALAYVLLVAKYTGMRRLMESLRAHGYNIKHVVVVGTGAAARQYAQDIRNKERLGYRVWGFVGKPSERLPQPLLCGYEGLDDLLHDTEADEVIVALEPGEEGRLQDIIALCAYNGIPYSLVAPVGGIPQVRYDINVVGSTRLLVPRQGRLDFVGWALCKRMFDVVVSAVGIVVLSPLLLVLALGVRLSGPGPILFRQERVGYRRKTFTMLKFRSMRSSGEESTAWTRDDDPRRTRFGMFIRKYSLDELPQLFNVLSGSMSLVGPRPELPFYVEKYRRTIPGYMLKHGVRPGMTGWAQVRGLRGDTSITKRIACDLWYIEHWSVALDLYILVRTLLGGMVNSESVGVPAARPTAKRSQARTAAHTWRRTGRKVFAACAYAATLLGLGYQMSRACFAEEVLAWWAMPRLILLGCELLVLVGLVAHRRPIEVRIVLLGLVWTFVSRLLVGENPLEEGGLCEAILSFACLFAAGACLGRRARRALMTLVTACLGFVLVVWALVGLRLMATLEPVAGFESIVLAADKTFPPLTYIKFYGFHRNVSPTFYLCEVGLLLYQCFRSENRAWKLVAAVFLPLAYLTVSVQRCRSVYLALAFLLTAAAALAGKECWWSKAGRPGRTALVGGLAALPLVLFVCYTPVADALLARAHQGFVQEMEAAYEAANAAQEAEPASAAESAAVGGAASGEATASSGQDGSQEATAPDGASASQEATAPDGVSASQGQMPLSADRRGTLVNTMSLSGRTAIWKALIPALQEHPRVLLVGQKDAGAMDIVNPNIVSPFMPDVPFKTNHMHNTLLQKLLVEGLLGFAICAIFLVCLLAREVTCVRRCGGKMRALCLLAATVLAMMGYGMLEPLLCTHSIVDSLLFCLIAGFFVRECDEMLWAQQRRRRAGKGRAGQRSGTKGRVSR